jgi:cbb3-type cytochrome oxidase maturation protein
MKIIFILIGCSLLLAVGFLIAFFWSIKSGQNEDLHGPSVRMLFEDENIDNENNTNK